MKKLLAIAILPFFIVQIYADTNLPASISQNTTLTKENSPYILTSSTTINSGITLTIEAGVILKLPSKGKITVNGNLYATGSEFDTILFTAKDPNYDWDCIITSNANAEFKFVKVTHAKRFISATGGEKVIISHCNITSSALGNGEDCIAAHDTKKVLIEYLTLKGAGGKIANGIKNDAIDLDNLDSCFISFSSVTNFSDDAIDIGTQTKYAEIHDNKISYTNYGISVGENSIAILYNNISHHNDGGFQIHTDADVKGYNNTLYANTVGIEAYHSEDNKDGTGGTLDLYNSIFSQNIQEDIITQGNSVVTISYSISDKALIVGDKNLFADPKLTDSANGNFSLQASSPCLTSGKPDASGNPTAMGSIVEETPVTNIVASLKTRIEVFPNPTSNYFVLQNTGDNQVTRLSIFNIQGKLMKQFENYAKGEQLNIKDFLSGVYILKLYSGNKEYSSRLIKK